MSNMILRCFAIYSLRLILLANVAFASQPQWSVLSWLSSSVCTLIVFPSNTQQWSLLGLNLWPGQTIEKPSDGFDLSGNPISRGKFSECRFVFLLCPPRRSRTNATHPVFAPEFVIPPILRHLRSCFFFFLFWEEMAFYRCAR